MGRVGMGVVTVAVLMAIDDIPVTALRLSANEAEEAVDEQTQEYPNGIEHGGGHEYIENGGP